MKEIPLTHGFVALVDDADFDWLSSFKWRAIRDSHTTYVACDTYIDGVRKSLRMHRAIIGDAATGLLVDHRDGNGLNNQRSNLRACTHSENQMNRGPEKGNTTGFKGVSTEKKSLVNPYFARIRAAGKLKYLGCYPTAQQAHHAYCEAAKKLHGEFARFK